MRHTLLLPAALVLATASLLPLAAQAGERCEHSQPRNLQLDLAGVKAVVFEIGSDDLIVTGAPGARAAVTGRACASDADDLAGMTLVQTRVGDKLVVRAEHRYSINFGFNGYRYMKLQASLPDSMRVQLKLGSGDARIDNVAGLSIDLGSGDVEARNVRGVTTADIGSGDVDLERIGSLQVISVGSGDLKAKHIGGGAKLGSIGSGDVELSQVGGTVELDRLGSGDLVVDDVRGDLTVRKVGSGSVAHHGVSGRVDVDK
ncbi:DUF4097 domain-containing protein [Lysobacter capsici]|uniref:DUF4097 family beta strand repeat-containing protein n=1 Tax=Lysobacter capsici TaxID=435897 RepID=UPI0017867098|nr:DUF4097 family beta strand repeat-containing protein [Lysobacter capsici]UOF12693.1 DUF4097 domain-containing protein [Lysobacter capsici]